MGTRAKAAWLRFFTHLTERFAEPVKQSQNLARGDGASSVSIVEQIKSQTGPASHNLTFEWVICGFAVGIAIYFALPFEPDWRWVLAGLCLFLALAASLRQAGLAKLAWLFLLASLIAAGLLRSVQHSAALKAPILPAYQNVMTISGWIEGIEKSGTAYRLRLRVHELTDGDDLLPAGETPLKLRVRTKIEGLSPGDGVSLKAFMYAPPGPVIAGGYDPARRAYFEQVGGYGFAISAPQPVGIDTDGMEALKRHMTRFRAAVVNKILQSAPDSTAGLQVALLTGERAYITDDQTEALRSAGLAHILALSGLHMGLVAGGAYYFITLCLALLEPLARRMDVRRPAAIVAMAVASFYFMLSTGTVSIQRAYIMAMVVFAALLLARPPISLRSVALAAAITLFLHPESLVSAGFQMSFAAAAALVIVYGYWQQYQRRRGRVYLTQRAGIMGWFKRFGAMMVALAVTSIVAGAATGGFAYMHFHYMTKFGLIGNLLAMPLFTFVVMPMGILAVLAMPFGAEALPLSVMSWGLDRVLYIAEGLHNIQPARIMIKAAPSWLLALYGAGFVLLILGPNSRRFIGLLCIGLTVIIWSLTAQPHMRVSEDGDIAFWKQDDQGRQLYVQRRRADAYGTEQFIRRAGYADAERTEYGHTYARCDSRACLFELRGKMISVVTMPDVLGDECARADMVIYPDRFAGPALRRFCGSKLIDQAVLNESGAQNIYLYDTQIKHLSANPPSRRNRPWG